MSDTINADRPTEAATGLRLLSLRPLSEREFQTHIQNIERDGYTIITDAIPPAVILEIGEEIHRLESVRPGGDLPREKKFHKTPLTRRWFDLLNDGDVWQKICVHPWLMQILSHVLEKGFLLSSASVAIIEPGEDDQGLHQDNIIYEFPHPHPTLICNTIWALSDFTEQNGATRVVPGSHKWGRDPDPAAAYDVVRLAMPAGSIALVVGDLYHAASANTSDVDHRYGLLIQYCKGIMRTLENYMLGVSHGRMMGFSPELQDILGFQMCKGVGGIWVQEPRVEMRRHYAPSADPYLDVRNSLHEERLSTSRLRGENPAKASAGDISSKS